MGMTINDEINKIVEQVTETHEKFIFETIKPFCESVVEMEISKEDLSHALLLWQNYDKRLKSDMVAMLTEIQTEIEELDTHDVERFHGLIENAYISEEVDNIIQQKIDKLKESKDEQ